MPKVRYVIQGLYGQFNTEDRSWQDWIKEGHNTLKEAQLQKKYYDQAINPKTTERSAPSASRIVKRTIEEEVVE